MTQNPASATLLALIEQWDFPTSPWEARVVADVSRLRVREVVRPAPVREMKMPSNACHDNARWYADQTPGARVATGWRMQGDELLLLHSVVRLKNGAFVCVTPSIDNEDRIRFINDTKIECSNEGKRYRFARDEREIGVGVRRYPELTRTWCRMMRERVEAGVHPIEAEKLIRPQLLALKAKLADSRW